MEFTTENVITLFIALIAAAPGILMYIRSRKEGRDKSNLTYQEKLRNLTDVNVSLLSVLVVYDLILQRIFMNNPEINSDLRTQWIDANAKLTSLRNRLKGD